MSEPSKKTFLSEVIHGFLASGMGKAIFEATSYGVVSLAPFIVMAQTETVEMPGWAVALNFATILAIAGLLAFLWRRRSVKVTKRLSSEAFGKAAQKAQSICILNTFIPNIADIAGDLVVALDSGADVKVLVLHPECEEAEYRAASLKRDLQWVEDQIRDTLDILHRGVFCRTTHPHLLKIRLFKSWPPFALYATNRTMMIGYSWAGELAIERPQLVLSQRHESFTAFQEQFHQVWAAHDSKELVLDEGWRLKLDLLK